ncbi:MAG TPA: DUF2194 domain-containing protein [Spirochaetota bacterium]|nr:DUF2194 domain-containing protein [Spirochaetota bacterium]
MLHIRKKFTRTAVAVTALLVFGGVILNAVPVGAAQRGVKVYCFYSSSEGQSALNNPVRRHCGDALASMGLSAEYRDFNGELPGQGDIENARAVISWYNGIVAESREQALGYIQLLDHAADRGVKVIVINSFGAYGYREGGRTVWLDSSLYNRVFEKIGFTFRGCGSTDAGNLSIVSKNRSMVEKEIPQDLKKSAYYQRFVPVPGRGDVVSHLVITRDDTAPSLKARLGDGRSSVVLTSLKGGFALERYVERDGKLMLNVPRFLKTILFPKNEYQNVAVILGDVDNRERLRDNVEKAFRYAKIPLVFLDSDEAKMMAAGDLHGHEALLVAAGTLDSALETLITGYLRSGGRAVFLGPCGASEQFRKVLGITGYGDARSFAGGFRVSGGFFIDNITVAYGGDGVKVPRASLSGATVIARPLGAPEEYPLAWVKGYGKGKLLYWNAPSIAERKRYRGALVQSVHRLVPGFVSGVANVGIMAVSPFQEPDNNENTRNKKINEYRALLNRAHGLDQIRTLQGYVRGLAQYPDMKDGEFYLGPWMKDMSDLQRTLNLRFTGHTRFHDSGCDIAPEKNISGIYKKGSLAMKEGGWSPGIEVCEEGRRDLSDVKERWKSLYAGAGAPVSCLVRGGGDASSWMKSLRREFPSVQTCIMDCGQGRAVEAGWNAEVKMQRFPVISRGYRLVPDEMGRMYDSIHSSGVAVHLLSPGEIFDLHTSKQFSGWPWMKKRFEARMDTFQGHFPWLRWMTAGEAAEALRAYESMTVKAARKGRTVTVYAEVPSGQYFYFRFRPERGRRIRKISNCRLVNIHRESGDMLFKTAGKRAVIVLR